MKRTAVLFIFSLTFCLLGFGQSRTTLNAVTLAVSNKSLEEKFYNFTAIRLESKKLFELVHQTSFSAFQLNLGENRRWDIDLEPSNITTSNYHVKLLTPQGMQTISSHPDFLFKGKVKGSNGNEQVRLTIKEGFIYGSIQAGGKEYFIEPLNRFTNVKEKDQYIVYEASDIIDRQSFSCGVLDKETSLKKTENRNGFKEQSPLDVICKKIKFISVGDYSIYQKFGGDVHAVETAFLSNLNLAEGAYTTLNFGPDGSTDVGTDRLQFEMEEVVVSTCVECDIARGQENASTIATKVLSWANQNISDRPGKIIQHWTTNDLFDITGVGLSGTIGSQVGCDRIGSEVLRYGTDDPSFLRVLVAHETGHTLGCQHDNLIKSSVTGFIMYSAANGTCTRFSTLADFGGVNYSSQLAIRNNVLANMGCLAECGSNACEEVKDLKINYGNFDNDIQFSWTGSGSYLVKYKVNDSSSYDSANIIKTNFNTVSLKGLQPCTLYKFEVQRSCNNIYSRGSSVIFKTSSLNVTSKPVNVHGDKYDLELNLDCKNCSSKEYFIKIDGRRFSLSNSGNLKQIIIKDLFADGAAHRTYVSKDSGNAACAATSFYTAPYYRSSSKKILNSDFNDCTMPSGWKDSLLAKRNAGAPNARWIIAEQNFFTTKTVRGSLDSTCMIYYNNLNSKGPYSGALSLTSPKVDLTKYKDVKLHFDYHFFAIKFPNAQPVGAITVEAFDGTNWQKLFERKADMPNVLINIWDSVPQRVFADLDSFKNKDFQVRFTVDDGSLIQKGSLGVFAAFDNIVVDGYLKDSAANNDIIVYPNPVKREIFIQFTQQPVTDISYRILDVSGRLVSKGVLNNYRISMNNLSNGMYLLVLYENEKMIDKKKIIKQ